jgi:hypothetical protein
MPFQADLEKVPGKQRTPPVGEKVPGQKRKERKGPDRERYYYTIILSILFILSNFSSFS